MPINIEVNVSNSLEDATVEASGQVKEVIPNEELNTWKLNDSSLKNAVKISFGKAPNDAYVKSPTPWGDLYVTEGWDQVSRTLIPTRTEVLSVSVNPEIIKTQVFRNNSSVVATFDASISSSAENTTTTNWSTGGDFVVGQEFTYGINFGAVAEGTTSMEYSQSWGKGGEEAESITLGSTSGVMVTLQPGEAVQSILTASRGVMTVRVTYDAYLDGVVATNYDPVYKDHHFWGLDVNGVLLDAGYPSRIQSTEKIEISYYSESSIEIQDMDGITMSKYLF